MDFVKFTLITTGALPIDRNASIINLLWNQEIVNALITYLVEMLSQSLDQVSP